MLVTGILPSRVCAVNDSIRARREFAAPKDWGALDPCDKHREEGGAWCRTALSERSRSVSLVEDNKKGGADGTAFDRSIRSMPASSRGGALKRALLHSNRPIREGGDGLAFRLRTRSWGRPCGAWPAGRRRAA
ncbi:hypothetical protein GFL49_03105 [Rhizobium leguminosarum bv. viciae]|nr:hypothetical protein [Rhizobium leguminosarum bv. viciae]